MPATDLEKLVVQLSADVKAYERNLAKASGVTTRELRKIDRRVAEMDRRLANFGRNAFRGLLLSTTALGSALSIREVQQYADAWTGAKNALAVAGVVGRNQVEVLDALYASAQKNATPITALTGLFGKAAQANDNLQQSQERLLQFTDGIAVALRVEGKSAQEASGALTQLGQLLGSARVQAEEFNSINEGARPILIAVANGLDAAGGSVSKLKQLVNEGEVSGRQFFDAFMRGFPVVERMAANATQTIEQGYTKVENAFTRYIGQTDESLSASQRLVAGLNALADNFDEVADVSLKLAAVLAAGLLGRGIAVMIATLPEAVIAVRALTAAMKSGTVAAGLFRASLGPIGLIVGIAAGAAVAFGDFGSAVDDATQALADQAGSADHVTSMIADVQKAQDAYRAAIRQTADAQTTATSSIVADTKREFEAKKSLLELELKRQRALIATQQSAIAEKGKDLRADVGGQVFTNNDYIARGYGDRRNGPYVRLPDDFTALEKTQKAIEQSPAFDDLKKLRAELTLTEMTANKLDEALSTTFADPGGGSGGGSDSGGDGSDKDKKKSGGRDRISDYERLKIRIAETTSALAAEADAQGRLNPFVEDYGFALRKAQAEHDLLTAAQKSGLEVTDALRQSVATLADAYATASVATDRAAEANDKLRQSADDVRATSKDAMGGFISDLVAGTSAADALGNALGRIGDRLLDLSLDTLFGTGPGIGGFFTALSGLGGGVRLAAGGRVSGPGGPRGDKIPAQLSDGEYVVNARATRDNLPLLEAINSGKAMMLAAGGLASRYRIPSMTSLQAARSGGDTHISLGGISIAVPEGTSTRDAEAIGQAVRRQLDQFSRYELPGRVRQIQRNPNRVG
ncbi:tape measure protein [Martelella sp.]|uniref:tape measure protein n=3 Tax=unclassified Martelella TaxID=2629616 RepID=UPI0025BF9D36|nr:tape measure protein [Martelella sp.]